MDVRRFLEPADEATTRSSGSLPSKKRRSSQSTTRLAASRPPPSPCPPPPLRIPRIFSSARIWLSIFGARRLIPSCRPSRMPSRSSLLLSRARKAIAAESSQAGLPTRPVLPGVLRMDSTVSAAMDLLSSMRVQVRPRRDAILRRVTPRVL